MTTQITSETTIEQVRDALLAILAGIGVEDSLIDACRELIDGESADPSVIQQAPKGNYQITHETAQQIFKLHALYSDEDLHETVTLSTFVLYWLTGLVWVLPQAERLRLEAAQSLARLGLSGEQLVQSQLYIMGESAETDWWRDLPRVNLDQLPDDPYWQEFIQMYDHLRTPEMKPFAKRYFEVLHQIGGLREAYFAADVHRIRSIVLQLLNETELEPVFIDRCVQYVLGDLDELADEPLPHLNPIKVPTDAWRAVGRAYEMLLMATKGVERDRFLRWFHLLHMLGGTDLFACFYPLIKKGRLLLLEKLFAVHPDYYAPVLVEHLNDSAKAVREKMIDLLTRYRGVDDLVAAMLKHRNKDAREAAVLLISAWNDDAFQPLLAEALAVEHNDSMKKTLTMMVKGGLPILEGKREETIETIDQFVNYCWKHLRQIEVQHLKWLDFDTLPGVRYRDSEEYSDEATRRYLLLTYAELKELTVNREAEKVAAFFHQEDLAHFAHELLQFWIGKGSDAKKKWVLFFAAMHGDRRTLETIMERLGAEWPRLAHGVIAVDAIRLLAMTRDRFALQFVDSVSQKFKYRRVKDAAGTAFEFAGEVLDLDPETLHDQVVPDLGFDANGEKVLDYGVSKFTVRVTPKLNISLRDGEGKRITTLPRASAGDDEARIKAAREELSITKKKLKETVALQTQRLEKALAAGRRWTQEAWSELFVHNPIMVQLAKKMIWGAYVDGVLKQPFCLLADGTLCTVTDEVYELPEEAVIGVVRTL